MRKVVRLDNLDCFRGLLLPILQFMRTGTLIRFLSAPLLTLCSLVIHPVFSVPFVAGVAYSYFYPEYLPAPLQAFAETGIEGDQDSGDQGSGDADLVDLGSPRPEKLDRDASGKKKKRELPATGVLSQTRSSGTAGNSVPAPWGSDALDKSAPPITGSVSRLGKDEWAVRIFNNSEDTYSVSVEVVQMGRGSKRLKSDNYSYTLKGKAKAEREFKANQGVTDCVLKLTRWKNLTAKKKEASPSPTKAAGGEVSEKAPVSPPEGMGEPNR